MADNRIYGEVDSKTGLERVFREIRKDVGRADSRPELTELYRRAGYLVALTQAPSWETKFGRQSGKMRGVAESEFATTARAINRQAKSVGTDADYDEKWGS
jgi:hypothetical protein